MLQVWPWSQEGRLCTSYITLLDICQGISSKIRKYIPYPVFTPSVELPYRISGSPASMPPNDQEHAFLRRLDFFWTEFVRWPQASAVILPGRNRDDSHVRVGVEHCVANRGAFFRVVQSDDQQVRQSLIYVPKLFRFFILSLCIQAT